FGVLYFIFYNIGLLPENVLLFHTRPWVAWLAAAAVLIGLILIARNVRRKLLLFVLLGMVLLRLAPVERPIDPVHLIGGGQLLLETALYSMGFVVIFLRVMEHPRWRMTTIGFTTFLCIVFFITHIRQDLLWREAGLYVRDIQQTAGELNKDDGAVGLCPDFRNYKGAPIHLSEALQYETPFNRAFNVEILLPMHYLSDGIELERKTISPLEVHITASGAAPMEFLTFPYELAVDGGTWESERVVVTTTSVGDESLSLRVESKGEALPVLMLPLLGKETGGETE
ncbi:MAG: hypothetical protein KJ052_13275, partial [Candidatus Hydrogenedentes bacterium]|nr:hypothetical protein [Candidatus Hydrogenedentota bacterium]